MQIDYAPENFFFVAFRVGFVPFVTLHFFLGASSSLVAGGSTDAFRSTLTICIWSA